MPCFMRQFATRHWNWLKEVALRESSVGILGYMMITGLLARMTIMSGVAPRELLTNLYAMPRTCWCLPLTIQQMHLDAVLEVVIKMTPLPLWNRSLFCIKALIKLPVARGNRLSASCRKVEFSFLDFAASGVALDPIMAWFVDIIF